MAQRRDQRFREHAPGTEEQEIIRGISAFHQEAIMVFPGWLNHIRAS